VFTIDGASMTQTPLPGPEAALIGLVALVVVFTQVLWPLAEHFNVMAHEGMHAIIASVVGFAVLGIKLNSAAEGETSYPPTAVGLRRVATSFAGYLGPSAFGLAAAKLITLGYIIVVLWVAVIFLALLLLNLVFPSFGCLSVPAAIAVLYLLIRYAPVGLEVVMAYGMTWLLLLSGVRAAVQDGANAGDARNLGRRTLLPRQLWALLWLAGTLGAVFIGVRLLVLRA
jgi:hypothetical protein